MTIPDTQWPTPEELNMLPCVCSDRYLKAVPEFVRVLGVCQDPNNPALVIIDYELQGSYVFNPVCTIVRVDGEEVEIDAPFAAGHYLNPTLPLDTMCRVLSGQLVFDFGAVIPLFLSVTEIEFRLQMFGTIPQAFGVNFSAQNPSTTYTWTKGFTPVPIGMYFQNGVLSVQFQYGPQIECSCDILCIDPVSDNRQVKFCPDETQEIIIFQGSLNGDPVNFSLTFEDPVGNRTILEFQSLINVIPTPPTVSLINSPRHVEVTVSRTARNGELLKNVEYQVYKYLDHPNNLEVWKDWSSEDWSSFQDTDVIPGRTYGYSVRYRGEYKDTSSMSSWATVNIPSP